MSTVAVVVNGEPTAVPAGSCLADLAAALGVPARGTAVARNATVVPRSLWASTPVEAGDRVELLTVAQGG